MKVVKRTGLVPVQTKKTGDIFGMPPKAAEIAFKAGEVTFVDPPAGIDFYEVILQKEKAPEKKETPSDDEIIILDGWKGLHHLKKIALAKALLGDGYAVPEGTKTADYAESVIEAEVQRRAAAGVASE